MAPGTDDPRLVALASAAQAFAAIGVEHTLIGGWTPTLLLGPGGHGIDGWDHIGSIDLDFVFDPLQLDDTQRIRLATTLHDLGARKRRIGTTVLYFEDSYDLPIQTQAGLEVIQLDVMGANVQPGDEFDWYGRIHMALRHSETIEIVLDGVKYSIRVVSAGAFILLKAIAMVTRAKPKDALDIYTILRYYKGGVQTLADEIARIWKEGAPARFALRSLRKRFRNQLAEGPRQLVEILLPAGNRNEQNALAGEVVALTQELFSRLEQLLPAETK